MAKRKRRRKSRSRSQLRQRQDYPGWMWMLFGLAIGLSVAFAVYVKDRGPDDNASVPRAAGVPNAIDNNNESTIPPSATVEPKAEEAKERRFTFYDVLPAFVFEIRDEAPATESDIQPQAVVEPGVYFLQAGSFSTNADADRRRAELALQGIESHIQRVKLNDRNYHRVLIGPTEDLDELNLLRSRLRAAKIDVLRIRVAD